MASFSSWESISMFVWISRRLRFSEWPNATTWRGMVEATWRRGAQFIARRKRAMEIESARMDMTPCQLDEKSVF
eukprot:scaffold207776_cov32-Tisochrysis_lutea.AAC.3